MAGHRNCCVVGCTNSGYKIQKWLKGHCDIHSAVRESESCVCQAPFTLYPFPSKRTASETRERWIGLIKRENPKNRNKRWEPTASSRVCSIHFVDQKPTTQHPDPTLNLGKTIPEVKKRKLPSVRNNIVEVKRRSNVLDTHSIQTQTVSQDGLLHSTMLHASQTNLPASNTAQLHASDTAQLHASQTRPPAL